jgi:hypothetical protein
LVSFLLQSCENRVETAAKRFSEIGVNQTLKFAWELDIAL